MVGDMKATEPLPIAQSTKTVVGNAEGWWIIGIILIAAIAFSANSNALPSRLLNDTGINWCADDQNNDLACSVSGYPRQDGDVGRDALARVDNLPKTGSGDAGFDFTKLDAKGGPLPADATSWSCVRDNRTGLVWEVKTFHEDWREKGLRDKDWTYTWYNPDSSSNGGSPGVEDGLDNCYDPERCDTLKFVSDVNAEGLCGASDWRLPSLDELFSIMNLGLVSYEPYHPAIEPGFFPNLGRDGWYWSNQPLAWDTNGVWSAYFHVGGNQTSGKGFHNHIRLVRDGSNDPCPDGCSGLLNDTGINWCADDQNNDLACSVSGYPRQDGDVGRDALARVDNLPKTGSGDAGFDFTKLDAKGGPLPADATSWSCVRDNRTGLVWEVKTFHEDWREKGLRDKDWTYTWYNPDSSSNGGSPGVEDGLDNCYDPERCDTLKFVSDVNAEGLCGASDWRLPSLDELFSIMNLGLVSYEPYHPAIEPGFFPNLGRDGWYWSNQPLAWDTDGVWSAYFHAGGNQTSSKGFHNHIRLVRCNITPDKPWHQLSIKKLGRGQGLISSEPPGIDCGQDCVERYLDGTDLVLLATPIDGAVFRGWSGDCNVLEPTCRITMDKSRNVNAFFDFCWECLPNRGGWRANLR
ncbi:MAG: hypothetical protein C1943_11410 [Halochromatium sp.]|nr:hypothetical protein [Halochromatium sp.]